MRRKQNEITDRLIIEEILTKSEVRRFAMMDSYKPYIVPLNYGYSDNALYIHSTPLGKKVELLKQNNYVCFEIEFHSEIYRKEKACDWGSKYRSVIGYGHVEIITNFEEKKNGLDIIMAHYGKKDGNVYGTNQVDSIVILKLTIDQISGKQLGDWN